MWCFQSSAILSAVEAVGSLVIKMAYYPTAGIINDEITAGKDDYLSTLGGVRS